MQNYDDNELNDILARKKNELIAKAQQQGNSNISSPITLTDSNFDQAIEKYPLIVVDFWAPWCGPCRLVSPIITQLASELAGKVVFGKVNVDECPRIASTFCNTKYTHHIYIQEWKSSRRFCRCSITVSGAVKNNCTYGAIIASMINRK